MKKFNFAALLPGFLALNNSVWASDSSTGASDLPGMTLNEHDEPPRFSWRVFYL
jgi:hypothetical protein